MSTASRVLNDVNWRVNPETRQRILEAAAALGYRPNTLAHALRRGSSRTIALVVHDLSDPFYPAAVKTAQACIERAGYLLTVSDTQDDPERKRRLLELLKQRRVDGLIITSIRLDDQELVEAARHHPIVTMIRRISDEAAGVASVTFDDVAGARIAAEHLLGLGHERIGLLAGLPGASTTRDRTDGYLSALRSHGERADDDLIVHGVTTVDLGRSATSKLLELPAPPTAIFAATDASAIGALWACRELNRRVPSDVSLVSYNDSWICSIVDPPLTAVRTPYQQMAMIAAEMLLAMLRGEEILNRRVVLPVTFIERASTAPPARALARSPEASPAQ